MENYFNQAEDVGFEGVKRDAVRSKTCGHGRIEKREIHVTENIAWLPQKDAWQNLKTIVMVKSKRLVPGQQSSVERRYYITSLPADALRTTNTIRPHWSIENQAHWILDVAFREDEQKADIGSVAKNMSLIRRIALNLLKQEKIAKCGVEIKHQMGEWDNDYLLQMLVVKSFS